jgi:hypothetical protein
MTESEANSKYTVAFINSLHVDEHGIMRVNNSDAKRLS